MADFQGLSFTHHIRILEKKKRIYIHTEKCNSAIVIRQKKCDLVQSIRQEKCFVYAERSI